MPACSTDQKDGDPLAELLRIIGDKDESHETDFEPKTQLAARARQDAGELGELKQPDAHVRLIGGDFAAIEAGLLEAAIPSEAERSTAEDKRPNARAPLISGDFAAIEAGLLGAPQQQATATVSEANMSNAFSSMDIGSQRSLHQDNESVSRHAGVADGQNRARRPLYVMVAIVIVAMAGIAVGFGLNSRDFRPTRVRIDQGRERSEHLAPLRPILIPPSPSSSASCRWSSPPVPVPRCVTPWALRCSPGCSASPSSACS